jgi:hypothetical protein
VKSKRGDTVPTAQANSTQRSGQAMARAPMWPCSANEAKVTIATAKKMHSSTYTKSPCMLRPGLKMK